MEGFDRGRQQDSATSMAVGHLLSAPSSLANMADKLNE
jgi:hypothetical protein